MRKNITIELVIAVCLITTYLLLHSSPNVALRTHLFMSGHPKVAITTGIIDDKVHNIVDKAMLEKEKARCYTLTKPAFEKETGSNLRNYKVVKRGFLYFASYYGEA